MDRRKFLASSVAAVAASTTLHTSQAQVQESSAPAEREYYDLRAYHVRGGPQKMLADSYFRDALIPALNRQGIKPVGAFNTSIGEGGSSSMYLLLPSTKAETLLGVEARLAADAEYQKAGAAFINAPAREPGFMSVESTLIYAFQAFPKLTTMPTDAPRLFEMRTYESPTLQDHYRKIEQMNTGEGPIFKKAGFQIIFMGDRVIGSRIPSLTYMIGFATLADRDKAWSTFFGSPEWKTLSADPRYSFEPLVSNIDNTILAPTAYSQI